MTEHQTPPDTPHAPLVVPKHGHGKIKRGGNPGNKGGGRTASRIRKRLAEIVEKDGVKLIKGIAAGTIEASNTDRLRAVDLAARYGIGADKDLTREGVRSRLQQTIDMTTQHLPALIAALPPDQVADALIEMWEPIWR